MKESILHNELKAQLILKEYLSEPSNIYNTLSGRRLQILSPGRINKFEGPDFLDMAVLINGDVIIGNSEFANLTDKGVERFFTGKNTTTEG